MNLTTEEKSATTLTRKEETTTGKKAPIWEHYKTVSTTQTSAAPASENAKCNYCNKIIKTNFGNTTGMRRHLENKHFAKFLLFKKVQDEYEAQKSLKRTKPNFGPGQSSALVSIKPVLAEAKQAKLTDLNKWDSDNPKSKTLTMEIGKWMASSLHPYSLVEEQGFINVMRFAQPMYKIPSSKTFSRSVIPVLYKDVKNVMHSAIEKQRAIFTSLSVTVDMWTSLSNDAYMALTTHFMDEHFTINNYCLGCYAFLGDHSGENISQKINECLDEWNLNNLTFPIYAITDNAKNVKLAINLCEKLKPLNCFAHTLQLALGDAKKGTQGMADVVTKARKVVGHYRHSSSATERLHNLQKEMGQEILNLIQDVETRWNSEYLMLSRLLANKKPVSRDLAASGKIDNLTVSEWRLVEAYVSILEPLYQATVEMCSSIMPTASLVIPILYCVQEKLKNLISDDQGVGKMFSRQLLQSLMSRFPNSLKVEPYITAMLVDPRFKDIALETHERALSLSDLKLKIVAAAAARGQVSSETTPSQGL